MSLEDIVAHITDPEDRAEALARLRQEIGRRTRRAEVKEQKYCPRCQTIKDLDAFGISRTRPDGRQGYCRACR